MAIEVGELVLQTRTERYLSTGYFLRGVRLSGPAAE
jgi:hypothetical protein